MGSTMHPCPNCETEVCGHSGPTEPLSFTDQMAFLSPEEPSWDFRSVPSCREGYGVHPEIFWTYSKASGCPGQQTNEGPEEYH